MNKSLKDFILDPPKISFCVAMILFFIMMSSMFTYLTIDFINDYVKVKDILQSGQLVEAEFKEVGRKHTQPDHTYGDGYTYYAIYEYYDENGNCYKTESQHAFKSSKAVLEYVEEHPTKSIYIDGKGHKLSGNESVTKYIIKCIVMTIVTVLFYAIIAVCTIQLVRRIKMDKAKKAQNEEIM